MKCETLLKLEAAFMAIAAAPEIVSDKVITTAIDAGKALNAEQTAAIDATKPRPEVWAAFELGYKLCERGCNWEAAALEFRKLNTP